MDFPATLGRMLLTAVILHALNAPSHAAEPETVVAVPPSIPVDPSRDVTADLNRLFAALPDGATVRFPSGARYRVDGTLVLDGKEDVTIEGDGVLFRAFDPGEDHAKGESYAGWRQTRNRAHVRL